MNPYFRRLGAGVAGLALFGLAACQQGTMNGNGASAMPNGLSSAQNDAAESARPNSGPTLRATATSGAHQVVVTWTPVAHATSYNVYRLDTPTGGPGTWLSNTTALSFTDTTGQDRVTYGYMVQAVNHGNVAGVSNVASAVFGQ